MFRVKGLGFRVKTFYFIFGFFALSVSLAYAEPKDITFAQAEKLFLEGRYEKTIYEADRLIESKSHRRDELYYLKGLSELKINRFGEARESFKSVLSKFPKSRRAFDARLGIADSYLLGGDIAKAIRNYNEILEEFSNDKNASVIYYRLGSCFEKTGSKDKAKEYLNKARRSSPLSFETRMVKDLNEGNAVSKGPGGNYSVQIGCFEKRQNAEQMVRKLSDKGYESYMETFENAGSRLYKVKAGRCRTRKEAESLTSRLKRDGYTARLCRED